MEIRLLATALGVASLTASSTATTLVPGGGYRGRDCYAEWRIVGEDRFPGPLVRGYRLACMDGDPACDVDGQRDGQCTLDVSICVLQSNVPECVPAPAGAIKRIRVRRSKAARHARIPRPAGPHLAASSPACGPPRRMVLPLGATSEGTPRSSRSFGWCNGAGCETTMRQDGAECADDDDPCTKDACAGGVCLHDRMPVGARCDSDDACLRCGFRLEGETLEFGCMERTCDDGQPETIDTCEDGYCLFCEQGQPCRTEP